MRLVKVKEFCPEGKLLKTNHGAPPTGRILTISGVVGSAAQLTVEGVKLILDITTLVGASVLQKIPAWMFLQS
ncbi:MAG: hypothetical protein MUW56_16040 [Chryseobacterium sp.]|nr:hypothetical protein [Chryseobacterium sp.]MCJ7935084.1 hypothetical protein [Chryseobacterium sp.]